MIRRIKSYDECRGFVSGFQDDPRFSQSGALTTTELQVLKLICANKSNAEIGEILDIKLATVKTHVSHVLQKLGVSRRSEVRAAAQKLWLISDEP